MFKFITPHIYIDELDDGIVRVRNISTKSFYIFKRFFFFNFLVRARYYDSKRECFSTEVPQGKIVVVHNSKPKFFDVFTFEQLSNDTDMMDLTDFESLSK